MEEKERYELFGEHCIKDNNPDARCQLLNAYVACVILNEQDKENQQLKHQLARTEKALELAVEQLDDAKDMLRECGKHDWAGMIDTSVDYFKARSKEMLKSDTSL